MVGVLHCSNLQDGEGLIGALLHGAPQDRGCLGGDGQGLGGLVGTSEEGAGTKQDVVGVLHGVVLRAVEGSVGVARAWLASFMVSSTSLWRVL